MNILGISAYYHDSAACLVQDGKIITPIGIALRLSGKELLDLRIDKSATSYWRRRSPGDFDAKRCESQY